MKYNYIMLISPLSNPVFLKNDTGDKNVRI